MRDRSLLYDTEDGQIRKVWADSLTCEKYRKRIAALQRKGALRIVSSYHTVSESVGLVIAGVIPIDLLAKEQRQLIRLHAINV